MSLDWNLIWTILQVVALLIIAREIDKRLRKFLSPAASATVILAISLILIILPLIFIINGLIEQVSLLPAQIENLKIKLPKAAQPVGSYLAFKIIGKLL